MLELPAIKRRRSVVGRHYIWQPIRDVALSQEGTLWCQTWQAGGWKIFYKMEVLIGKSWKMPWRDGGFPAMFDRINLGWILGNQARWWFDNFSFHPYSA
jgi:hypothetical protein